MEWELTDEENPYSDGLLSSVAFKNGAQAQAEKLVEWLGQRQISGWPLYDLTICQFKFSKDEWQELRRQVGLE